MYAQRSQLSRPAAVPRNSRPWTEIPATQQVQEFEAHIPLFFEGDEAGFVYEMLEGVVCCYRMLSDGRRQVFSFCYPGDLIGLVRGKYHRCSTETLSPARIRRVPKSMLLKTASKRPELGRKLLQFATTELAEMQDHFVILGRKSALEKVASFVYALAQKQTDEQAKSATFDLPMTRTDIGDYLGLTLETVSRSLTKLKIAGAIDLPQPSIVAVRDMIKLRDSAEEENNRS